MCVGNTPISCFREVQVSVDNHTVCISACFIASCPDVLNWELLLPVSLNPVTGHLTDIDSDSWSVE